MFMLIIISIPLILFTIILETRIGITKHPDRFRLMTSIEMMWNLNNIYFLASTRITGLIWGSGRIGKLFGYIRRLRGELPSPSGEDYWDSFIEDSKQMAIVLKERFGIGGGIYTPNKEKIKTLEK